MLGKTDMAYDNLFKGSSMLTSNPQALQMLKNQTGSLLPLYGKVLGYEMIREETIGTSIVRLVYVLKSEVVPTVWEFYFYKPKDKWFVALVTLNDRFKAIESKK